MANRGYSIQRQGASVFLPAVSWTPLSAAATSARNRFPALIEYEIPLDKSLRESNVKTDFLQSRYNTLSYNYTHITTQVGSRHPDSRSPRVAGVGADASAGTVGNVTPHFLRIPAFSGGAAE